MDVISPDVTLQCPMCDLSSERVSLEYLIWVFDFDDACIFNIHHPRVGSWESLIWDFDFNAVCILKIHSSII